MIPSSVRVRSELLPLTPAELRTELKYEPTDCDQLTDVAALRRIKKATGLIEDHLSRFIFPTEVQETWYKPDLCKRLRLKWCDVREVVSITAIDADNVETAITAFQLIGEHGASFLDAPESSSWASEMLDAVRVIIVYRTGMYETVVAVDPGLVECVTVQALWGDMNREQSGLGDHVKLMLEPYARGEY